MPKRDKTTRPTADGAESASVLKALLERHPELRSEAEALGKEALGEVSFLAVAGDVQAAVLQFDYDDLNDRAGAHSWGYVEPGEAANELMEEAVEPFVSEMKRYLELGLEEQARQVCQGILLGLYRAENAGGNEILDWAEDFPAESAGCALEDWMQAVGSVSASEGRKGRRLSSAFAREHLPGWDWALKLSAEER